MKYQFIDAQSQSHSVHTLRTALETSRCGHYATRRRVPSLRSQRRTGLTSQIRTIRDVSRQTYGSLRVHADLFSQGVPCHRNTVTKFTRKANIVTRAIRRFRVKTNSKNTTASPNLMRRVFQIAPTQSQPSK